LSHLRWECLPCILSSSLGELCWHAVSLSDHTCTIHVPYMSHTCTIHGPYVYHTWAIHVPYMDYAWTTHVSKRYCTCTQFATCHADCSFSVDITHASVTCNNMQVTFLLLSCMHMCSSSSEGLHNVCTTCQSWDLKLGPYVELLSLHLDSTLNDESLSCVRYSHDANSVCKCTAVLEALTSNTTPAKLAV